MTEAGIVEAADGCAIAYRFDGEPGAPVLLLSNSLGTSMDMWQPQMPAFATRCRVLRYDSRGHGRSGVYAGAYSLDRLGGDVLDLLDALQLDRVDFCGLSLGGMVGQWLGYRAPHRLRRLVIANSSAYMGPPSAWQARIAAVTRGGTREIAEAVVERWFSPDFRSRRPDAVGPVRALLEATAAEGYAGCCAAIRDMDLRPVGPLIPVPALVIGGRLDPATPPDHAERLAAAIPGAKLVMLAAAHLSNIEAEKEFTAAVMNFLARES